MAYWRSVVLECVHQLRDEQISIRHLSKLTGICPQDITTTLHGLNMLERRGDRSEPRVHVAESRTHARVLTLFFSSDVIIRLVLVRREKLLTSHITCLKARPRQLEVDPECLRWTPVIVTNTVVSDADGEEEDEEEEDEGAEKDNHKEVTVVTSTVEKNEFCGELYVQRFVLFLSFARKRHKVTKFPPRPGTCTRARRRTRTTSRTRRRRRGKPSPCFLAAIALRPRRSTARRRPRSNRRLTRRPTGSAGNTNGRLRVGRGER